MSPFQSISPSNYLYPIQRSSPAQATRYPINQTGIYFDLDPNYLQYSVSQEQLPASSSPSRGFYPNLNTGNLAPSLPPHCCPARRGRKEGNVATYSSPGSHTCHSC